MSFTFEDLPYQKQAVQAVVDVFAGQPKLRADAHVFTDIYPNQCDLSINHIHGNLLKVFAAYGVPQHAQALEVLPNRHLDLCVEMETGTGKTLVYWQTICALYQTYGFSKFIILVPSVAIRAGVLATYQSFAAALQTRYSVVPDCVEYDSGKMDRVHRFVTSAEPQVLVMTLQSFTSDAHIINQAGRDKSFRGMSYFDALAQCRPIIIMDEPQEGMDTDNASGRLAQLNAIAMLRYSATHRTVRNVVYRLTPQAAYSLGLVKKVEVLTVAERADEGTHKMQLVVCESGGANTQPKAKFKLWRKKSSGGFEWKETNWVTAGKCLAEASGNASYSDWTIAQISKPLRSPEWRVQFTNGVTLHITDRAGDTAGLFRLQLRYLIQTHLAKKERLGAKGIKCLSLIFIDRVANYMKLDGSEPIIKQLFEEEYATALQATTGKAFSEVDVQQIAAKVQSAQGYYFATTGKGEYTDSESAIAKNKEIYKIILQGKEELLSFDSPIEFIFTHTALGVGWDSPNVFNIATLSERENEGRMRQELGRGLRIAVNQAGQRCYDGMGTVEGEEINLLTVVPNLSWESFTKTYQAQEEAMLGDRFDSGDQSLSKFRHSPKGQTQKKLVKLQNNFAQSAVFKGFWRQLSRKVNYKVVLDEQDLVNQAATVLTDFEIPAYVADIQLRRITQLGEYAELLDNVDYGSETTLLDAHFAPLDWVQQIVDQTSLSQWGALRLLGKINKTQFVNNPPVYIQQVAQVVRSLEQALMLRGLSYEFDKAETPALTQMIELKDFQTLRKTVPTPKHGVFDHVATDSGIEGDFAADAEKNLGGQVVCFLKLPDGYKVPTPHGNYRPDFGVILKRGRLGVRSDDQDCHYFVVETKGTANAISTQSLTEDEKFSMACAKKYFQTLAGNMQVYTEGRVMYIGPIDNYRGFEAAAQHMMSTPL